MFGQNCQSKCHCNTGTCNPDTGVCLSKACAFGWKGTTCSEGETVVFLKKLSLAGARDILVAKHLYIVHIQDICIVADLRYLQQTNGTLDMLTHGTLDMLTHDTLDMLTHGTLDMLTHSTLDMLTHGALDMLTHGTLDMLTRGALDMLTHGALDMLLVVHSMC